jgi:hypothetical protein
LIWHFADSCAALCAALSTVEWPFQQRWWITQRFNVVEALIKLLMTELLQTKLPMKDLLLTELLPDKPAGKRKEQRC